jgi:magnesium transporter
MNFDRSVSPWTMPELGMRFGYPAMLLFMLVIVAGMLLYFKRKRWF